MYDEKYLHEIADQLKKTSLIAGILFVVFLGISIALANFANNVLGMIILVIGVCLVIFYWGMYGDSVLTYYRFVRDIVTGRSREISGVVKSLGDEPVHKDNRLLFREVVIDEDGMERMLLLDAQNEGINIVEGVRYQFIIYENYIRDIKTV